MARSRPVFTTTRSHTVESNVCLHDYFAHRDGGGKLVLTLARELGWPVITGSTAPAAGIQSDWPDVPIRVLGNAIDHPLVRIAQQAWKWNRYEGTHETVVYSGYYSPLARSGISATRNLYYCNTPPRFLYDQKDFWMNELPAAVRPFARVFLRWYRTQFENAVDRMDVIVANSHNVRRRIKRHLGRDSKVVYPPCDTTQFNWAPSDGYFLSTGRLDPIKRVDRIIDAFKRMNDQRLVITSDGPLRHALRTRAAGSANIEFTGAVSPQRLRQLISRCTATIYVPVQEDFGLSVVESLASGKPVISVNDGGVTETMLDGKTGILVSPDAHPDEIVTAVRRLTPRWALSMKQACQLRASSFDVGAFVRRMRIVIEELQSPIPR